MWACASRFNLRVGRQAHDRCAVGEGRPEGGAPAFHPWFELGAASPSRRLVLSPVRPARVIGGAFLFSRAETAPVVVGYQRMMDRLLAVLSLGAVALIVAAPLWH